MSLLEKAERDAKHVASLVFKEDFRLTKAVAPIASPMCQAVDWDCWRVDLDDGHAIFLKLLNEDAADWVDISASHEAAQSAAALGIGPQVIFFLPEYKAIAFEMLESPWRSARLDDLNEGSFLDILRLKQLAFRQGKRLCRRWNIFSEIRKHVSLCREEGIHLPKDIEQIQDFVQKAEDVIEGSGIKLSPCFNNGISSNIMVSTGLDIKLVDYDCAGMADPYYDDAVIINEISAFEISWESAARRYLKTQNQKIINRTKLYALADDLFWGIWGIRLSQLSKRPEIEFLKYGEWRLLRCRMALSEESIENRLLDV